MPVALRSTPFNYKPYVFGLVATLVLALGAWWWMARPDQPAGQSDPGYAALVTISGAKVSEAESMMAGGVVYYDGLLENHGNLSLTGYTVDLTFHDIDGKPIETDRRVLLGANLRPLPPHASRSFEIGFDKVPDGWNQVPPTATPVAIFVH